MNNLPFPRAYRLPSQSFTSIQTTKLKLASVLWTDSWESTDELMKGGVYCVPQTYESALYDYEHTRNEAVDIYGGFGIGAAGGSGRCSIFRGMQTKGVGRTPLVSLDGDHYHSSGTMSMEEACQEAIFSAVYGRCLPFGALETVAVALTGGKFVEQFPNGTTVARRRALIFRPFTIRPAHFLRNLFFARAATTTQSYAVGLTADAHRTQKALLNLPKTLAVTLGLTASSGAEVDDLYDSLRELGRRYAHQIAASFAKRLPHGALNGSNLALNGAYLDFGVSSYVPDYRRQARSSGWIDPWTEKNLPLRALTMLYAQYFSYCTDDRAAKIQDIQVLESDYYFHYDYRLTLEMIKMTGLPEDLARECPSEISAPLFREMRKIWTRGAQEPYVSFPAAEIQRAFNPPPRSTGRYKLNKLLSTVALASDRSDLSAILAKEIDDPNLLIAFEKSYLQFRSWLENYVGTSKKGAISQYIKLQALRKNGSLEGLSRLVLQEELRNMEVADNFDAMKYINDKIEEASYILSDLHPKIPGRTGIEQINSLMNGFVLKMS